MFKLQRFYSLTSFMIIFVAAALLTLFYRQVTLHWIERLTESSHQAVAQTALNFIEPDLVIYLGAVADASEREIGMRRLPSDTAAKIRSMLHGTTVHGIDIYNRKGLLVFSTHADTTGIYYGSNPALQSALDGSVTSTAIFQSIFRDKLMQTYMPIRSEPGSAVIGAFAIHSDMSRLIEESDTLILHILAGAELILAILYVILLLVARHAKNIIHTQQTSLMEKTANLEILSRRLLKSDELQKKKIATDLHEGLAQTLSAIKVNVESNELKRSHGATQLADSIVPVLQHAIHEVRTIATGLHPPGLDALGLLPTINGFCREFERQHPVIRIRQEICLQENNVPSQLKLDIYRIIESAFNNIAKYSGTDQICLVLHLADDMIHLVIDDTPARQPVAISSTRIGHDTDAQFRFAEIKARTSLSGGIFSNTLDRLGWATVRASWACRE